MTPDWLGINADNIALAQQIAGKDYVILLADVYGVDLRPKNAQEAGAATKTMYDHRGDLRARIGAALAQLKAQAGKAPLDGRHYGAIGFCFGGATTLDLARSGADVLGVVSFHGNLSTDDPALAKNIKAKVLVLHGADDTFESPEASRRFPEGDAPTPASTGSSSATAERCIALRFQARTAKCPAANTTSARQARVRADARVLRRDVRGEVTRTAATRRAREQASRWPPGVSWSAEVSAAEEVQ